MRTSVHILTPLDDDLFVATKLSGVILSEQASMAISIDGERINPALHVSILIPRVVAVRDGNLVEFRSELKEEGWDVKVGDRLVLGSDDLQGEVTLNEMIDHYRILKVVYHAHTRATERLELWVL